MSDDLVKEAQHAVGRAFATRGRPRGGVGGQTIEATMRATFHEISAYDLDAIIEAIEALQAERDAAISSRDEWKRGWYSLNQDTRADLSAARKRAETAEAERDAAVLAEREACAKLAEHRRQAMNGKSLVAAIAIVDALPAAIRARSNKEPEQ